MYLKIAILRTYLVMFPLAIDQEHGGFVFSDSERDILLVSYIKKQIQLEA